MEDYPDSMSKYGNRKTAARDGKVFSSAKECRRYTELKMLFDAGEIEDLRLQRPYELIPKQDGERSCVYIADFTYVDKDGRFHCEDTKGFHTKDYIIKRKLMLWVWKIRIEEL